MTFFYDLNKRLADLAKKQDAQQISEDANATTPKSKLTQSLEESALQAFIGKKKYGDSGMKALQKAGRDGAGKEKMAKIRAQHDKMDEAESGDVIDAQSEHNLIKTLRAQGLNDKQIHRRIEQIMRGKAVDPRQGARKTMAKEADMEEGNEFSGELVRARAQGAKQFKVDGKEYPVKETGPMTPKQKSFAKLAPPADKITFADKIAGAKKEVDEMLGDVAAEAIKSAIGRGKQQVADEGNAFTGALAKTPRGGKFKVGSKEFTDNSDLEEGFADMDAWLASREKEKGTGKFDKKERTLPGGMKATTYTRKHEDDKEDDSDAPVAKGGAPKKRGRPMGKPKGPERITKGAWKHKAGRMNEAGTCPHCGGSLGDDIDEEKIEAGKRKFFDKLAPAAKQAAKVIGAITKGKKAVDEESTDKEDIKAEKAGKKVAKDIEHDEGHKAKGDNKAEKAGKKVTKDIEYDDKKDRKEKKEEKVDETTTSGSVATSSAAPKAGKGGMQFGKGVYENFNNSVEKMITESVDIAETISENEGEGKTVTVTASGAEADMLMQLLKAAGLSGQGAGCGCGQTPCGCAEVVDENSPDWPTNTVTGGENDPNLRTYSGGLNKPKSTGQTTIPVIAAQQDRLHTMEESVELERSLFKTWKNYKG